jgi:hypothetical protein
VGLAEMIALFSGRNSSANPPGVTAFIPKIMTEFALGEAATYDAVMAGTTRGAATPESLVTPFIGQIDQDRVVLAYAVALAAAAFDSQTKAIETLLSQLSADSTRPADLSDIETLLDDAVSEAARDLDVATLIAMGREYARLLGGPRDAAAIRGFVATFVPEPHLDRALGLIAVMSEADVAAFFARAERDTGRYLAGVTGSLDLAIYACQESIPFNSREGFEAELAALRFQFLAEDTRAGTEGLYDLCESFDPVEHPGFHDPFTTDVPVLALAGLNDTQTNGDAAGQMAAMIGAQAVTLPESGHGTLLFSRCAVDIALGFVERPGAPVNAACVEGLRPAFVMP